MRALFLLACLSLPALCGAIAEAQQVITGPIADARIEGYASLTTQIDRAYAALVQDRVFSPSPQATTTHDRFSDLAWQVRVIATQFLLVRQRAGQQTDADVAALALLAEQIKALERKGRP